MYANDQLTEYTCTEHYYKHLYGIVYTDGVRALCHQFECYWFLDLIVSYQPRLKDEEFQLWCLVRHEDESATVTCTDGNDKEMVRQQVDWTDFKATEAAVWVEFNVVLLPSEH
ncbi:DUF6876 family protein [Taibaiella soli]|uniref:DUF6876 domain-containing protein n=1 Tax=Taibaiella soli TaxID=1649169 RepID=A0A2W2AK17_9BACT|nr:DUF6876 family protein [Taibaiella soli]PZF72590.1 hypothetical protein DN068_12045 [Taibaiella soli]